MMPPSNQNSKTAKAKARQNCIHCKKRYTPFRATSKYCSDSCRVLACNLRKTEAADKAAKYEDSMQRSLRWHRKQDHLQHLPEDELRTRIEAKWDARKESDRNRRAAAKERYADEKLSCEAEAAQQRLKTETESLRGHTSDRRYGTQQSKPVFVATSNNPELSLRKNGPRPKIETKRKRVIVPRKG